MIKIRVLAISLIICASFLCSVQPALFGAHASDGNVRVLLVGSEGRGASHWLTKHSFMIENLLHFNGIPYDFFDVGLNTLSDSVFSSYQGVILEGYAMAFDTGEDERVVAASQMEAGSTSVLLTLINGAYYQLNPTIYGAIDVNVDGAGNLEQDIDLLPGAASIYDYAGDNGFVVVGGADSKHVGVTVVSMTEWMPADPGYGGEPCYGVELALKTWLEKAFGTDTRVTMPIISLRLDDAITTASPRDSSVIDFIEANRHRIRGSGYSVTNSSAYQLTDSLLQRDEQVISQWGSMSLHGKDHTSVGAEGENQGYATQYAETNQAVAFLEEHFPRYKPIKACPNNSWNEATLHALYNNGIYYHSADMFTSPQYQALYKSLFDVDSDMDRERMFARLPCQFRYYPLVHVDGTGEARIYSVDWNAFFDNTDSPSDVLANLRRHTLEWWSPLMLGFHFYCPGSCGSNTNPEGWISVVNTLMESVDADHYQWRRWVDNYDYARNVQGFDRDLHVNGISVVGDVVTYDVTADQPVRFVTLRAARAGYRVSSVTVNGTSYAYFGDDYVHLPEIGGNVDVVVHLAPWVEGVPHVTYVSPNAVIEDAQCADGRLHLDVSGEFAFLARVAGSNMIFANSATKVFSDGTEEVRADASSQSMLEQIGLSVTPSAGAIEAVVSEWDTSGSYRRAWTERYESGLGCDAGRLSLVDAQADVVVEDLKPNSQWLVSVDSCVVDTCYSDASGEICFSHGFPDSSLRIEVYQDSSCAAGVPNGRSRPDQESLKSLALSSHPNPFNRSTSISYQLGVPSRVRLNIYSVDGGLVCRLVDRGEEAGLHSTDWNGCDGRGSPVSPGLYFCRIETAAGTRTLKIALFR